jgi:hypothetical protein
MKKQALRVIAYGLTAFVIGVMCLVANQFINGSLSLWYGVLPSPKDQYLDGSGRMFQKGSWHLGNATRTWGETYGIKFDRFYLTLSVKHINSSVSEKDAHEAN